MRKLSIGIVGGLVAAVMSLAVVQPAAAHAVRSVGAALQSVGPLTIALGWLHEPAYVGFDNAVQVIVTQGNTAVTAITDKDLTVEVSLGNQKMSARPLIPSAIPGTGLGTPGEYEMHFIPTVPGNYTFHIKGSITGVPVDLTVTAGPTTFELGGQPRGGGVPRCGPDHRGTRQPDRQCDAAHRGIGEAGREQRQRRRHPRPGRRHRRPGARGDRRRGRPAGPSAAPRMNVGACQTGRFHWAVGTGATRSAPMS